MGSSESSTRDDTSVTAPERVQEDQPALAAGTVLAGRYEIQRLIGEGGMGEVYLARHSGIDKLVAIKLLAPDRARRPKTISRFIQEARATSKIRHKHIVDITDFGEIDGLAFFVMEYLDGEDLSAIVKREGPLSWSRAKALTIQILEGLGAAHDVGIIHRDVKPHNCFVCPRENNPEFVKIIDFGIAKLRDGASEEQLTQTGAIMGTADYMSPEQGQGMELDGRSDLYSVGIILYRMLTGRVPFKAGNAMATVFLHVHNAPKPPSAECPEAGFGSLVDALVLKALAKDPAERFASAAEFIDALEQIDDAGAGSPTPWTPLRIGTMFAAVALGALAVGWVATRGGDEASLAPKPAALAASSPIPSKEREPAAEPEVQDAVAAESPTAAADPPTNPVAVPNPPEQPQTPPVEASVEPSAEPAPAADVPVRRSKRAVAQTLGKLNGKVSACGKKAGLFRGESVDVTVAIATQGRASRVDVKGTHAKAGVDCIVKAIKRARFGAAQRSQTTKHRFKI
ncbi:MAG: protein kinase domain-containing protein [Nannocystales bacterium]